MSPRSFSVSRNLLASNSTDDCIQAGFELLRAQSVLADESEDEQLDAQTVKPDFAIGNDKAGLNHVTDTNFGFELAIDDLDVQVRRRDFAGFDVRAFHFVDDGQNSRAQFKVVELTITVGHRQTNAVSSRGNRTAFRANVYQRGNPAD